jgi:hypothetical protein
MDLYILNVLNSRFNSTEKDICLFTLKAYLHPDELYRVTFIFLRYYIKQEAFADYDISRE